MIFRDYRHLNIERDWGDIAMETLVRAAKGRPLPELGVEIPTHGVRLSKMRATVESLLRQTYAFSLIVVGINGHHGEALEAEIVNYVTGLNDPRVTYFILEEGHKRAAMAYGYRVIDAFGCLGTWNADADTRFDKDCSFLVQLAKFLDRRVRAVTSNVQIDIQTSLADPPLPKPLNVVWLVYLTSMRYLFSNMIERAAQSLFYCVSCMSGPLMACYTADVRELLEHPEEWERQMFGRGKRRRRVGPGDDRTQTQRFLSRGHGTVFLCDVFTYTDAPDSLEDWIKQQRRWSRSALRGYFTEVGHMWFWKNFHVWTILDEWYVAWFSFILTIVVVQILLRTLGVLIEEGPGAVGRYLLPYLIVVASVNILRAVLAAWNNWDWRHLATIFYLYHQIRYLVRIKIQALGSMNDQSWETRQGTPPPTPPAQ
jgi:cellulose synthase/poly-beta-1,6-N-acetylglucosamine synthase-like glycosyltransferase